jgi:thiol:disulfide interchange protein
MKSDARGWVRAAAGAVLALALLLLPRPSAATPPEDEFVESYKWLEGADGYAEAQRLAKASGRPVVVYFYTDWCHFCRELERELLETPHVRAYLRGLVKVRVNPEAGPAEGAVGERHGVTSYPGFFIGSPRTGSFVPVRRHVTRDGEQRLMTPAEFVASCRKAGG